MNDPIREGSVQRMGFMIPLILFVLMFALCCAALSGLYVRSMAVSTDAGRLNDAVSICRSQAERFRAGCSLPGEMFFDENFQQTDAESASYRLDVTLTEEKTAVGTMEYSDLTVSLPAGEPIYSLRAARYVHDGR